ncbi:MAG: cell division ATP-binding protein FtsE [Patescibacteria group bacterium]|nr:cell division ATP-binding protein FtsE [Patescibacteria group bacterium]
MIIFENISKVYPGNFPALENVNLKINKGEFVSIVGHSGAGKSTLLKMLYAEEQPTSGDVYFDRKNISEFKVRELPYHRRNIGTVFQDCKLLPKKTLAENVAFAMEVSEKKTSEIEDAVPQILDITGLGKKLDAYPNEVSGGEQQKAALARALVNRPKVLVADEPTGNLDPISTWDIMQLLLKINEFGTTVILATHDKPIIDKISKRVVVMDKGRVIRDEAHGRYCI